MGGSASSAATEAKLAVAHAQAAHAPASAAVREAHG